MNKHVHPKYVIAPKDCNDYFTGGKKYKVNPINNDVFYLTNDMGTESICRYKGCAHLGFGDWIIPKGKKNIE